MKKTRAKFSVVKKAYWMKSTKTASIKNYLNTQALSVTSVGNLTVERNTSLAKWLLEFLGIPRNS